MSRTARLYKIRQYSKECAAARRLLERKFRRQSNAATAKGEELPRKRGTQGWFTW